MNTGDIRITKSPAAPHLCHRPVDGVQLIDLQALTNATISLTQNLKSVKT